MLRFQKSTYLLNRMFEQRGGGFDATRGINAMDHAKDGGGFPLHIEGTGVVGAITVSGIPQRDDHGFVVSMLCQYLKIDHEALKLGPERA